MPWSGCLYFTSPVALAAEVVLGLFVRERVVVLPALELAFERFGLVNSFLPSGPETYRAILARANSDERAAWDRRWRRPAAGAAAPVPAGREPLPRCVAAQWRACVAGCGCRGACGRVPAGAAARPACRQPLCRRRLRVAGCVAGCVAGGGAARAEPPRSARSNR